MAIYVQSHTRSWLKAGQISAISLPRALVAPVLHSPLLVASGNHVSATSEALLQLQSGENGIRARTSGPPVIAEVVQSLGGPRPYWHPDVLKLLLSNGRLSALADLLRSLLKAIEKVSLDLEKPRLAGRKVYVKFRGSISVDKTWS